MSKAFLGIDPGRTWGFCVCRKNGKPVVHGAEKFTTMAGMQQKVLGLIQEHDVGAVLTCRAMGRNQQVIRVHGAMAGVIEWTCEKYGIPYFDVQDSTMRKVVVGKGNAKKPEVMAFLGLENEHAADAMVGARYLAQMTVETGA